MVDCRLQESSIVYPYSSIVLPLPMADGNNRQSSITNHPSFGTRTPKIAKSGQ